MTSLHILTSWTLFLAMMFLHYSYAQCNSGWFGTNCRYRCHCVSDKCNTAGECEQGFSCVSGWFGPSCQYSDMDFEFGNSIPSWLNDNNKTTCQPDQQSNNVSISFSLNFHFTWMKLVYTQIGNFSVTFNKNDKIDCLNMRRSVVDSTEMDVSCQVSSTVNEISVSGDLVGFLCGIFVSGGRNVALKQSTRQSTTYTHKDTELTSDKAVDGNTDSNVDHFSCTHTSYGNSENTEHQYWVLDYHRSVYLYRAVLYNRKTEQQHLRNFEMKISDADGTVIEIYTEPDTVLQKYFVSFTHVSTPIRKLVITSGSANNALTLCEVETFGDYVCDNGKGGLDCDKVCSCKQSELCFTATGRCARGCPAGFYGPKCDKNCHGFCDKQECHYVSGDCFQCASGYRGNDCETVCRNGKYGHNCSMTCPSYCSQRFCFPQNGSCVPCAVGMYGSKCSEACPPGCAEETCGIQNGKCQSCKIRFYTDRCDVSCVMMCENETCNQKTGYCGSDCPPGKYGPKCLQDCQQDCVVCNEMNCLACSEGLYGDDCSSSCPANCGSKMCEIKSGLCKSCIKGFYGIKCNRPCHEECRNTGCDFKTGECTETSLVPIVAATAFLTTFFILALLHLLRRKSTSRRFDGENPQQETELWIREANTYKEPRIATICEAINKL